VDARWAVFPDLALSACPNPILSPRPLSSVCLVALPSAAPDMSTPIPNSVHTVANRIIDEILIRLREGFITKSVLALEDEPYSTKTGTETEVH